MWSYLLVHNKNEHRLKGWELVNGKSMFSIQKDIHWKRALKKKAKKKEYVQKNIL